MNDEKERNNAFGEQESEPLLPPEKPFWQGEKSVKFGAKEGFAFL